MDGDPVTVRVDAWIWSVRLTKTRSLAATACRSGHVRVNGERVKPAQPLHVGDEVRLRHAGGERVVEVTRLVARRVGAPIAARCLIDRTPELPPQATAPVARRERGAGRPTKRERRDIDRLRRR
jgi:ribosome-associated heat shock protein Hsp15